MNYCENKSSVKSKNRKIKRATLERLMNYYLCLREEKNWKETLVVSSAKIAEFMDMDDTQVRKDLASIGLRGRPRIGFDRQEMIQVIRHLCGFNEIYPAIVIGAGGLGGAIARYVNFRNYGVFVRALTDNDPNKIGKKIGCCKVYSVGKIRSLVESLGIKLGIVTCPANAAQEMTNELVKAGIKAIWNFAPTNIVVPKNIILHHQHLSVELVNFTYYLKR